MSEGQKRAWFDELKIDFPNLPDEFIRMSVEAFDKEPAVFNDLFRNERKRLAKERASKDGSAPAETGRLTFAQLEERAAEFERQRVEIERESKAYVQSDPDPLTELNIEDKEKDVQSTSVEVC